MIEMDEQFQREFGAAMASLRAVHASLVGTAENARGEARSIAASEEPAAAIPAYEVSHAFWSAAERVRPVIAAFEDADRRAAQLTASPPEPGITPESLTGQAYAEVVNAELGMPFLVPVGQGRSLRFRVLHDGNGDIRVGLFRDVPYTSLSNALAVARADRGRVKFLEEQLQRLDAALGGPMADTEDLIDLAIRKAADTQWQTLYEAEKARHDELAKVTTEAAKLLGVSAPSQILAALERLVTGKPFDFDTLVLGSLIAGEYVSAAGSNRKTYVGRFCRLDADGPVIEYVCECSVGAENGHIVSTKLGRDTVRLPTADEIIAFGKVARKTGLLRLPTDSEE